LHTHAIATVEIAVGNETNCDKIAICDVGQAPWQDPDTAVVGHFVAVRWTRQGDGGQIGDEYRIASVHRLRPGEMLGIGRNELIGGHDGVPAPTEVSRHHATLGMNGQGHLVIENRTPTNSTTVRNLIQGHERSALAAVPLEPEVDAPAAPVPQPEQQTAFLPVGAELHAAANPGGKHRAPGNDGTEVDTTMLHLPERDELAAGKAATVRFVPLGSEVTVELAVKTTQSSETTPSPAMPPESTEGEKSVSDVAPATGALPKRVPKASSHTSSPTALAPEITDVQQGLPLPTIIAVGAVVTTESARSVVRTIDVAEPPTTDAKGRAPLPVRKKGSSGHGANPVPPLEDNTPQQAPGVPDTMVAVIDKPESSISDDLHAIGPRLRRIGELARKHPGLIPPVRVEEASRPDTSATILQRPVRMPDDLGN